VQPTRHPRPEGLGTHQAIVVAAFRQEEVIIGRTSTIEHANRPAARIERNHIVLAYKLRLIRGGNGLRSHRQAGKVSGGMHDVPGKAFGNGAVMNHERFLRPDRCRPMRIAGNPQHGGILFEAGNMEFQRTGTKRDHARPAHLPNKARTSSLSSMRVMRPRKSAMLRVQKADSGFLPTTSPWVAW
jgi:hypothetical protein